MNDFSFPSVSDSLANVGGRHARIVATATTLPSAVVTNQAIVDSYGHRVSPETIRKMVGVSERRVAEPGTVDSDLLVQAAKRCLTDANLSPNDLGKLIVTKFLGDRVLPMTASLLQRKLGCDVALQAFDVDGGIHSFVQAMEVGANAIAMGEGPVLIVSGGVINCLVSRTDPRVAFQYGDGAAAVLLAPANEPGVLARHGFSNFDFIDLTSGFAVRECIPPDLHETKDYDSLYSLYRQSDHRPVLDFVRTAMAETVQHLLQKAGCSLAQVDFFLLTETHQYLSVAIREHLEIDASRNLSLLLHRGNTMSAMLPMQLDEARRTQRVGPGSLVMLLSIGEGLSGGGLLISL